MRVLLYTTSFTERRGGVEKRYCLVANELVSRGHSVRVLCARDNSVPRPRFPLDPAVEVHFAKVERESIAPLLREFRPEAVIATSGRKTEALLGQLAGSGARIVITEQQPPEVTARQAGSPAGRERILQRADCIHLLMPSFAATVPEILRSRVVVIPNHCDLPEVAAEPSGCASPDGRLRVAYLGRLDLRQKRPQLLISAFGQMSRRHPDWDLWMWGEPHDRRTALRLHAQVLLSGLRNRVYLAGPTDNVAGSLANCHLYVMPSSYESFGQSLIQAMAAGLPCVGFAGCPAVNELIVDGTTGVLVPGDGDAAALAGALDQLMGDSALRVRLGTGARAAAQTYTYQRFIHGWMSALGLPPD